MDDDYDQFTKRMTSFDMNLGEDVPLTHSSSPADDFLAHFGVKGMKWGVTRKVGADGTVESGPTKKEVRQEKKAAKKEAAKTERKENWKKPVDEDAAVSGASRQRTEKHGTDALSNKELQSLVTRMNLEQQYSTLQASGKAKSARKAGQEYVADILKDSGKELMGTAVKWAVTELVKSAFSKATGGAASGPTQSTATRVSQLALEAARQRSIGS